MPHTTTEELFYTIALTQIPEVGNTICKNLIAYCGSAQAVFSTTKSKLKKIPLVGEVRAEKISQALHQTEVLQAAEQEVTFIEKHKIQPLLYTHSSFPQRLLHCNDAPALLFYKGNADLNATKTIAIVGTRSPTEYGKEITQKIVKELYASGITILSGMAYGIDGIAHQTALEYKLPTIGVLAHGLNRIYPDKHKNLAKQMINDGGLLTEYTTCSNFHPGNFPERNRIVAGMSDAVIVIESDIKGGAVITANIANSYNRDVFAIPGKVGDKYSKGCNFLLKTYKASIIESGQDLLLAMNWEIKNNAAPAPAKQLQMVLSGKEKIIYDMLSCGSQTVDTLLANGNLSAGELSAALLEMEMNGIVIGMPGKKYKLNNH